MESKLPRMHIEAREGAPHRVPVPDYLSAENMAVQVEHATILNQAVAKVADTRAMMYAEVDAKLHDMAWPQDVLDILHHYISDYVPDLKQEEIIEATREVGGFAGFDQVAIWVQDDQCSEFFNKALSYCMNEGLDHQKDKGFIDGSGIGYLNEYRKDLKENIEKAFDAKYWYKVMRPLEYVLKTFNFSLIDIANKIHPGHWSYPQGHSTKSFTAVQTLRSVFHTTKHCDRYLFIFACVFGHGRDGNLIHHPMDTYGSGYVTTLEEFAE